MASNDTLPKAQLVFGVPVIGPQGVAATLTTTAQQVLAFDAVRRGVIFANPGTETVYLAPVNLAGQPVAGAVQIYPQEQWELFADPPVSVNTAWKAWVAVGPTAPLTILNFTDINAVGGNANGPLPQSTLNMEVPIVSPLASGVTVSAASVTAIGSNIVRRGISFFNGSDAVMGVAPSNLAASIGAGSLIVLPGQTRQVFAKGNLKVNCGWNAFAQGSNKPLTVLEHV